MTQQMSSLHFDEHPRGAAARGATQRIAQVLHDSGFDAQAGLYDEALVFARDGRLAQATERLRMLLVLDPSDADAALLLAKVLAGREKWQEAIAYLDMAMANGALLPPGLRDQIELGLRAELHQAEEHRERVTARETIELRNLRGEAKRLRSENAALEVMVAELQTRTKWWSSAAAIFGGVSMALFVAMLVLDRPEAPPEEAALVTAPSEVALTAPAEPAAPQVASPEQAPPAVPEAVVEAAPAASPVIAVHAVKSGDTLGRIARRYYGRSNLWPVILEHNASVLGGDNALAVGMKLEIPRLEEK